MKKIDTLLFDFDGTIMDTNNVILQSWQHTFMQLTGQPGDESVILSTFGEPLQITMKQFFGGDEEDVARNVEIYRSYQKDRFLDLISLFPGVYEMLEEVRASGMKTALVTSRLKSSTMRGVEKFDLAKFFDIIITADDVKAHKPDPQPILTALERLGSRPENAVMIGDTKLDLLCARNAGTDSVLVGWSMALSGEDIPEEYRPDYRLSHPGQLMELVLSMNDAMSQGHEAE